MVVDEGKQLNERKTTYRHVSCSLREYFLRAYLYYLGVTCHCHNTVPLVSADDETIGSYIFLQVAVTDGEPTNLCQSVIQRLLPLATDKTRNYRPLAEATSHLLTTHQHANNLNFITRSCETLHNVHPSLLQNNTYQRQACSIQLLSHKNT